MTDRQPKHEDDHSLFTFKGHSVYSTLIRCQFSPLATTGQRYVYTGSADGQLKIYDLVTGDTAMTLRKPEMSSSFQRPTYGRGGNSRKQPARDISWHPFVPVIASTDFAGCVNLWTLSSDSESEKLAQEK